MTDGSAPQLAPFEKMNGNGNAIIVADMRGRADDVTADAARAIAQHSPTSFDQLMAVHDPAKPGFDARIMIFNADGSRAGACGNGTRCVADFLHRQTGQSSFRFQIDGETVFADHQGAASISVEMGAPRFHWEQIPLSEEFADTRGIELQVGPIDDPILHTPSVMNIGNPHAVFWIENDPDAIALDKLGPMLEFHPIFPERANISIAQVVGADHLKMRTWERGTGLTLACGSAACAAAVCAARTGRTGRRVDIDQPGGRLVIEWRDDNMVVMTGPAAFEFAGEFDPASGQVSLAEPVSA